MADDEESFTRHHDLLPLDTQEDVEELLRGLHKEFVAKVYPVESGLQDCLIQNKVLGETDNESLTGPHLPVRKDKARHLFKLLYSISHGVFLRDVLPVLCHKYYYIIPARFWKADVRRTDPEHAQTSGTTKKESSNTTTTTTTTTVPPSSPPSPDSHFPDEADSNRHHQCLRCKICKQVRPVAVADFLFQQGAVSFKKYCQLTKDYRIAPDNWPALFASFKSLPRRQDGSEEEELLAVLRGSPPVSRADLQSQLREGFPCQCHKGVDSATFASLTKNKREQWCQYYRRWKEEQTTRTTSISDLSSSSLYPSTECDGSNISSINNSSINNNNSSSINNNISSSISNNNSSRINNNISSSINNNISSSINNNISGSINNSRTVGRNSAHGQHQQEKEEEVKTETSAAQTTPNPPPPPPRSPPTTVQATDDEGRGMVVVRPDGFRAPASDSFPAAPCPDTDCSLDENVEARLFHIARLLENTCPDNSSARNARTLNIRRLRHLEEAEDDHHHYHYYTGKQTWPRWYHQQGGNPGDWDDPGLEAGGKGRRESLVSVLIEELEKARSVTDIPAAVMEKSDGDDDDDDSSEQKEDDDDAESSSAAGGQLGWGASTRSEMMSQSPGVGWSGARPQSEITLVQSRIPAQPSDSISADPEKKKKEEKEEDNNIPPREKLVTATPNVSSVESGGAAASMLSSTAASSRRSQPGLVAQRIAQFQPQPALETPVPPSTKPREESARPGSQASQKTGERDPPQPTSRERCVKWRYDKATGKGTATTTTDYPALPKAQNRSADAASLARDPGSPSSKSPSGGRSGSGSGEPPARPTRLPLETSATAARAAAATMPTQQPSMTSPVSLLPTGRSPDDDRHKKLEKAVRKGHFEKFHSILLHLPQKDDRPHKNDDEDDDEEPHVPDNTSCFSAPETASTSYLHNPTNWDEPEVGQWRSGEHHVVWEAVADAWENSDLKDLCEFAATEVADLQKLKDMVRGAAIPDRRAREEIRHLMHNYTCMTSRFAEIRQQRQDTFPPDPPPPERPHRIPEAAASASSPPPETPPPRIPTLLLRVEQLCGYMLLFTRVNILCELYLHSSLRLTSQTSRTAALRVVHDVIILVEWTSLQGWEVLVQVGELRRRLPPGRGEGQAPEKVGEVVALMEAFLENA